MDPVPVLASSKNEAIRYFARRDLLNEDVGTAEALWELKEPVSLVRRQQRNGSWRYPGMRAERLPSREDYDQLETYRSLGILVEKYAFTRAHPSIERAGEFLFSRQTDQGDLRGIYGNQYSPNYTAAILELLLKAGYAEDARISAGFRWLLSMRQDDGGWAVPLRTRRGNFNQAILSSEVVEPDRTKPSSHLIVGIVLRAFAAHPNWRSSPEAVAGADLLTSRLLQRDVYPDRNTTDYWTSVSFPFWFTDIVSALDTLSWIGLTRRDPRIRRAADVLVESQKADGTFGLKLLRTRDRDLPYWIVLAACRALKRLEA